MTITLSSAAEEIVREALGESRLPESEAGGLVSDWITQMQPSQSNCCDTKFQQKKIELEGRRRAYLAELQETLATPLSSVQKENVQRRIEAATGEVPDDLVTAALEMERGLPGLDGWMEQNQGELLEKLKRSEEDVTLGRVHTPEASREFFLAQIEKARAERRH